MDNNNMNNNTSSNSNFNSSTNSNSTTNFNSNSTASSNNTSSFSTDTNPKPNNTSAFSGGTKVTFNQNGTYSSSNKGSNGSFTKSSNKQKTNFSDDQKAYIKKSMLYGFLGALIAILLVVVVIMAISAITGKSFGRTVIGSTGNTAITQDDDSETLAEAVSKKCLPSVVSINVYSNTSSSSSILGYSNSDSSTLQLSAKGSGVVLSNDGYIITNHHVIDGAKQIKVHVGESEIEAELVGADSSSDVAVIKLKEATSLTPIELGDSDTIKIGEWVMSIGCPFGLEQSVATGIVSATSRSQVVQSETDGSTKIYTNMIQTDAAINPGNSGGALVDAQGKLIGINALITSSSGNYSGVGFAIPVNYARDLAKQIIDGKTPSHAQLGLTMTEVNSSNAKQYGWPVDSGAYVSGLVSGGPAERAGIKVGDIIVKLDDQKIESPSDLQIAVRSHSPNETVTVELYRSDEKKQVQVVLGSDEGQTTTNSNSNSGNSGNSNNNGNSNQYDLDDLFRYFFGY